jgi:hypothetical protein
VQKLSLFLSLAISIVILGLTLPESPFGPGRDRVPPSQKVAHSNHCSGCHGVDEEGLAMVDKAGNDVSIFDDWQFSMMGLSARDPFWRATMAHEVNLYPSAQGAIETTCLKCHAPLGSFEAHRNGQPYSYEIMLGDSLGLDGVSCSSCHQQPASEIGRHFSGDYVLDTNRVMFGHYPNPFKGPMQIYVGFEPEFSDHIYSSGVCAGCHTLITETLQPDGTPSGNFFVEQATFHEWLNSSYSAQGQECQTCHMPFIEDGVIVATDFAALEERQPYGLHQFFGANTAMLELMREHQDTLGLPKPEGAHAWDESITNNRISLSKAAVVRSPSMYVYGDTLYVTLEIKNRTGHKLPSGYPSRLAWFELSLQDRNTKEIIYLNGALDDEGKIIGRDFPFEPHHEVSRSNEDVQIYELVMSDLEGHLTTRLNAAYQPMKDNRLLPYGFNRDHHSYDTVAVWGSANTDPDYVENSSDGTDRIEYRIPLGGKKGLADLTVALQYQTLPTRWMADLFTNDTLDLVAHLKTMYEGYNRHHETINQLVIDSIDLSTSSTSLIESIAAFTLAPNPVSGAQLQITLSDQLDLSTRWTYSILDINGRMLQSGYLSEHIELKPSIRKSVFYFALHRENKLVGIKPFTVL